MLFASHSPRAWLKRASLFTALFIALISWLHQKETPHARAQTQSGAYKNFESPQVHPLAVTPDGTRLLAVNSPNHALSIFYLTGGDLTLTAEIPVGLEPVSVTARNDNEAWVANWLSDSVSVVDLKSGTVKRTIDVGDEPTDIVFAGTARAFVCVSGLSQVKVFDANALDAAPQVVNIRGKQPRALTKDATGARVFVSVFESGNNTTVVPFRQVQAAGGAPPPTPQMSASLPAAPSTGLIVKRSGGNWVDERGDTRWSQFIPYTLADVDVAVIDANAAAPVVSQEIHNVGTTIGNATFDSTNNRLYVANLEAHNDVRFEPNLRGKFVDNRVSIIALGASPNVTVADLNPHINRNNASGSEAERAQSLALPADIVRASDGTLYIAATGSAKVGALDANGAVRARIAVGQGPTGLALDPHRSQLYVLNRFDETISVVDLNSQQQKAVASIGFNPEPDQVRNGRRFLYDGTLSAHGDVACASCHLNAHRDGLAWDLGDPQGSVQQLNNGVTVIGGIILNISPITFHPMKGPMTTQSLRGLDGTTPFHWRGDRAGLADFNPAFMTLLGGTRQLTSDEMNAFQSFISSLTYPPNPRQNLDRTYANPTTGASAARGQQVFTNNLTDQRVLSCNQCHAATNGGTGTDRLIISALALQEGQDMKVPQLRGLYQKVGLQNAPGEQLSGFGFSHDGSFATLFDFLHAAVFNFADDNQRRDVEAFVLSFDTGTAPTVGLLQTVDANNKNSAAVTNRINLLMAQADMGNCELVARGIYGGVARGFFYAGNGMFQTDRAGEPAVSWQTLAQSPSGSATITFAGVPVGAGRRIGIARSGGSLLNGDLPAPANPIDSSRFFVAQHYADFLNRDPDSSGLQFWLNEIASCNGDAQCIDVKRQNVSAAYFLSTEFQQTGYLVYKLWKAAYGNIAGKPVPVKYSDFIPDLQTIGSGVIVGQGDWQTQLETNKQAFVNSFVARAAFVSQYPSSLTNAQYVDALNANTNGALSQAERDALVSSLSAGTETRATVLRKVAENANFDKSEFSRAFVLMQYFGYLRRDPDAAPDKDFSGYNFWLNKLNSFNGDYIKSEMVRSFIVSSEYRKRFGGS